MMSPKRTADAVTISEPPILPFCHPRLRHSVTFIAYIVALLLFLAFGTLFHDGSPCSNIHYHILGEMP